MQVPLYGKDPSFLCDTGSTALITKASFPKRRILDSSKPKQFADNNFQFDEYGRKFSKGVEKTVGKGETAHYDQFLLFPKCFQKTCTADT